MAAAGALTPPGPVGTTALLFAREARARLASSRLWLVASAICLIAWAYGAGFQETFRTESVLVTTNPLMMLDIAVVVFLGVVLGLRLAASLAWEREHRMLEVLLTGPVAWTAIVASKFLVEFGVLVLLVAVYAAYLLLAQPLGAGVVGAHELRSLGVMPLFALPTLALGLLVGAWAGGVRVAVVTFMILVGVLTAYEIALGVLVAQAPDQMSLTALYARRALETAAPFVRPVSAIGQLASLVEALTAQAPLRLVQTGWALGLTLLTVAAAVLAGRARGALE